MATKVLVPWDFTQNEIQNVVMQNLGTAPGTPKPGQFYFNTANNRFRIWNGTTWDEMGTGGGSVTNVSVTTANGFEGTVSNPTTTPSITIKTSVTGILKGDGTGVSAAAAGTDFAGPTNGTANQVLTSNGSGGFGTALTNSISIAGTGVGLGGTISRDTITGISSGTGLVKRTNTNTYSVATVGTDFVGPTTGTSIQKADGSGGLTAAASGTDYAPATPGGTAILKANNAGGFSNAVSGTDYAPATSGTSLLKGNGSGGFSNAVAGTDYAVATNGTSGQILTSNNAGGFGTPLTLSTATDLGGGSTSDTTVPSQKAVKTYVDTYAQGLDFKNSVRVVVTTNGTLASAFANGQSAGGVTLATGDRIVLAGQSTASQNGIYTVNASGAPTRATDADATGEISNGTVVYVEEGTNAGQIWVCSSTSATPWVPGSSSSTWTQFSGAADITATAPIKKTGNNLSLDLETNGGLEVNAGKLRVATSGTGAVARKYSETIGNGSLTTIDVTHSLGTKDVVVSVREVATDDVVYCDVKAFSTSVVRVSFATAPSNNSLRVTVIG